MKYYFSFPPMLSHQGIGGIEMRKSSTIKITIDQTKISRGHMAQSGAGGHKDRRLKRQHTRHTAFVAAVAGY